MRFPNVIARVGLSWLSNPVKLDFLLKESAQVCKASLCTGNAKLKEEIKDLDVGQSQGSEQKPKRKKERPSKDVKKNAEELIAVNVSRLDFRIGKIIEVRKHPDAHSLYVEKVNVNETQPRTVVSGLVKHMPPEDLEDRMVVLLCNVESSKMRGITSEAMVMVASTPDKVEVLIPPEGCVPGDLVEFEGFPRNPDLVLKKKKKIFETCAPDLKTDADLVATYKGVPFVVQGKGKVVTKSLANAQIK